MPEAEVKETWKKYWDSSDLATFDLPALASYQQPIFHLLRDIIDRENVSTVLAAGCGQDFVSFHLQKHYNNKLRITLLDIADKILAYNKALFERHQLAVDTAEASVFSMPFAAGSYDLVFNTGLMEHFGPDEQVSMTREILRVLKPGGLYVSANPSDRGRIYKYGMATAQRKGTWEYGVEIPVRSLRFIGDQVSDIGAITEIDRDFAGQLHFLSYVSPALRFASWPIRAISRNQTAGAIMDATLGKVLGTYLRVSMFRKNVK